jgi:serine phosphatase RsbU (regulator of sigma subunit)/anti-sigma regulatory factor (Ser/Thr protein kinase)
VTGAEGTADMRTGHARLPADVAPDAVRTALGVDYGDPVLLGVVDLVMASPLPMVYAHGPELRLLYNAAYAALAGAAHPGAFGAPAGEPHWMAGGRWDGAGNPELVHAVVDRGEAVLRQGDDAAGSRTFTRGHSPVRAADGRPAGMLTVVVETTQAVTGLDRLGRLATVLSQALSADDVVRACLRHAVTELGVDYARLWLEDPSRGGWLSVRRLAADVADPATERLPLVWSGVTPSPDPRVASVARHGQAVWLEDLMASDVAPPDVPTVDGVVELDAADRSLRSVALLPLRPSGADDAPVALLTLGRDRPGAFDHAERALMTSVAALMGRALHRARTYEEERVTGRLLQRSLLPDRLPARPDVVLTGRYEPAGGHTGIGGDFYDAFTVADGQLALVVGDAMGRGVVAATVMGQVRAALRALALADPSPAAVLDAGDRVFRSIADANDAAPEGGFLTVTYVLLDPVTGDGCVASAGHPPPVVRRTGGAAAFVDVEVGPPLGLPGEHPVEALHLDPGDLLLLFTDGLVERRGEPIGVRMQQLLRTVDSLADADPYELSAHLLGPLGERVEDDVAVLSLQRTTSAHRTAERVLPADVTAPRLARRWVRETLSEWGVEHRLDDVQAALTEVVTNAVLHAGTASRVGLRHGDGRLFVDVADTGRDGDAEVQAVEPEATRGRGLALVAEVTDAWGSQRTTTGQRVWFEVRDAPQV